MRVRREKQCMLPPQTSCVSEGENSACSLPRHTFHRTYFPSNLRRVDDKTVCRNANVSECAECQYTANEQRELPLHDIMQR